MGRKRAHKAELRRPSTVVVVAVLVGIALALAGSYLWALHGMAFDYFLEKRRRGEQWPTPPAEVLSRLKRSTETSVPQTSLGEIPREE
jgi:hypothetical protein